MTTATVLAAWTGLTTRSARAEEPTPIPAPALSPTAIAAPSPGPTSPPPVQPAGPDDPLSLHLGPDARLSLHPLVQGDARFFLAGGTNVFTPRRVRPAVEALLFDRFFVRITPELAGTPSAVDAFIEFRLASELQVRVGKFKSPVGLERLQQDADLAIVERGLQSGLLPDRDVGVQLQGTIARGILTYAIGLFDGAGDAQQIDTDIDDKKDVEGRLFVRPFAGDPRSILRNVGIGFGATTGVHSGVLPGYKTGGQNTFFAFAATATAGGTETRLAPQLGAYVGPIGVLAEYAHNAEAITNAGTTATIALDAWSAALAVVVTGEDATYGTLKPNHRFDPDHGGFGALELDARASGFSADDAIFTQGFADPNKAPHKALELSGGAQWILAPGVKWVLDGIFTSFTGGAPQGCRI
ncbi:MAG: porin [Polyangiales bacterium]